MMESKICALLSPRKMGQSEKCSALSQKAESPLTNNQSQGWRKRQIARLVDPQFACLTPKQMHGDHSAGTQSKT